MSATPLHGLRRLARPGFFFVAATFTAAVIIQIFLAGLATFDHPMNWARHVNFVNVLRPLPLLMLLVAVVGRLPSSIQWQSAALLGLIFVQYVTAHSRGMLPWAAATHPVTAMVLLWMSVRVAATGWRLAFVPALKSDPQQKKEPVFVHAAAAETKR